MIKITRQHDAMDCGPACLCMMASYFGKHYSLDSIREKCFLNRDGASILDLAEAGTQIGLSPYAGLCEFKNFKQRNMLPCIIHWEQKHFVVIYKIKSKHKKNIVYLADPEKGYTEYEEKEFLSYWLSSESGGVLKGYVLGFEPTPDFFKLEGEQDKSKFSNVKFITRYYKDYGSLFMQIIVGLALGSVLQLIFPFLTQAIVDIGIGQKDIGFIWLILMGQIMLLVSSTAISFVITTILKYFIFHF